MTKVVALILLEGQTEEEFYSRLLTEYAVSAPRKLKNLHGNININAKIVDAAYEFSQNNPNDVFDVVLCLDQERPLIPPFNRSIVEPKLKSLPNFRNLYPVIAVLMIESLFFLDIEGIYSFLRAPHASRNLQKFRNFRRLRHQDLTRLFQRFGRIYQKGYRCERFVAELDLTKIAQAPEIAYFIKVSAKR